jgi:hypothetical protein
VRKPARAPAAKVKHVNWTKLPDVRLLKSKDHVWAKVLELPERLEVNLDELETLFSQAEVDPAGRERSATAILPKVRKCVYIVCVCVWGAILESNLQVSVISTLC